MTLIIQKPNGAKLVMAKDYAKGDLNYSNVLLLLHGHGANNGTTFTDSSGWNRTLSVTGDTKTVTGEADPFGNTTRGIMAFNSGSLIIPASPAFAFALRDFTIEFWLKTADTAFDILGGSAAQGGWGLNMFLSSLFFQNAFTTGTTIQRSATAILDNAWHHVAITRASNVYRMFFDGVQQGADVSDVNSLTSTRNLLISGGLYGNYNGRMADMRITDSVARYIANFTPPIAPFADAQY